MRLKFLFLLLSGGLLQPAATAPYLEELTRIRTLLEDGDFRGALVQAKQLNKKAPDEIIGYQLMATAELALGQYSEAEKSIQWMLDLKIGKTDSAGWMLVARFREDTGDVDGAIEAVNQSFIRLGHGQNNEARRLLSNSARLQYLAGKLNLAEMAAKEAMKIAGEEDTLAAETLARVRLAQNRRLEALESLRETGTRKLSPRLMYLLAEISGLPADYAAFEKTALEFTATPDNANRELALYYATKAAKPVQAVGLARAAAERMGDIRTQDALAVALFAQGETAEARKLMKAVLEIGTQKSGDSGACCDDRREGVTGA
jgi:Flp pilus assembly protein TadD